VLVFAAASFIGPFRTFISFAYPSKTAALFTAKTRITASRRQRRSRKSNFLRAECVRSRGHRSHQAGRPDPPRPRLALHQHSPEPPDPVNRQRHRQVKLRAFTCQPMTSPRNAGYALADHLRAIQQARPASRLSIWGGRQSPPRLARRSPALFPQGANLSHRSLALNKSLFPPSPRQSLEEHAVIRHNSTPPLRAPGRIPPLLGFGAPRGP